jgi:hypothetical protein
VLAYRGVKFDRMLANQNDIPILERHLANTAIVEVGTVEALGVFKNIVAASPVNLGVISGHSGIINAEKVIRLTADCDHTPGKNYLS